uniref:Uncharacterized protein n=1 Tax=Anguilla anguilla TaxID=7936 RepID=A0A0E9Y066_ANGAN
MLAATTGRAKCFGAPRVTLRECVTQGKPLVRHTKHF